MIHIDNQQDFPESMLLERAARLTLETCPPLNPDLPPELSNADISIVLTDDRQLHELNLQFLGVDSPTDVLSFPSEEFDPETDTLYLGDILISIPRARQQAEAAGHPLEAEVQLLVVHGTLHLLGHDHAEADEKARMWEEQSKVLAQLGLGRIKIQDGE